MRRLQHPLTRGRFLMLLSALMLAGCGGSPFRSVERSIRSELPELIGPADRYDVRVSRSSAGLLAGRIPWIEIRGRRVRAIPALMLDQLEVRLDGVRFNRADHSVKEIERSRFLAQISTASVAAFIQSRSPRLGVRLVALDHGEARVRAEPEVLGVGVPVEIEGRPVLRGATRIDFEASHVAVMRLGLPEFVVRRLESRINPLIDLSAVRFPLVLTAIRIEAGQAIVEGSAMLPMTRLQGRAVGR